MLMIVIITLTTAATRLHADTGTCGGATTILPFTDIMGSGFFCSIAEAYFSGLTNGTSPTTYSPSSNVTRDQMAAFITRTMDQSLKRGSRRAALKQFWIPTSETGLGLTAVGTMPRVVESDRADLWVANHTGATVSRVRASDGRLLETWTGATSALGVVAAKGLIFVTGDTSPGKLYKVDPAQLAGPVTTVGISLGDAPQGISFDGGRIWTANNGGSVSIVTLSPLAVSTVTAGFIFPIGILYDGANIWITDLGTNPGKLFKLDPNGAIIQTVTLANDPAFPVFDGTNIWVPNQTTNTVMVVRASTGVVLATLTGNGLNQPVTATFDGERVLVTNFNGNSVSLWKAGDLSPLGSVSTGLATGPNGACSDGLNFWVTLGLTNQLARF